MARVVYVNGRYGPWAEALIHAEDRGFQFGDAIYEVCEIRGRAIIDVPRHLDRLERSLGELRIAMPMARAALERVMRETIRRNRVTDGTVYLQVSRGVRPRDFLLPGPEVSPTVVCLARSVDPAKLARAELGIAVKSMPDNRWGRCDIKTVMLLPASLAKEAAKAEGASEAWFVDANGYVTEGASSNAWIIDASGHVVTRPCDQALLRGVTRTTLMDCLRQEGLTLVERAFTIEEARGAREAFVTSASSIVTPVTRIDATPIGAGTPGPIALKLRALFHHVADAMPVAG